VSLVDEVRRTLSDLKPDELATHLIGGLTVAESGSTSASSGVLAAGGRARRHEHVRPPAAAQHAVHPRLVVLDLRRRLDQPDVLAAPPARGLQRRRDLPVPPDVRRGRTSSTGTRSSATTAVPGGDFGRSSLEGGDVQPIGNGTVLIGLSERTQARMIEQIARALFAKGAAERVIAAVMTKDRAHMHLDTSSPCWTATRPRHTLGGGPGPGISLRPGASEGRFHVTEEEGFLPPWRTRSG
jgi:arginine deiminase